MDGYTYENTAGGWSMCDRCGLRVSDEQLHDEWHKNLRLAIVMAASGKVVSWDTYRVKAEGK